MHELLATLYYAVDYDSVKEVDAQSGKDDQLFEMCARKWIAADAWALFQSVMKGVGRWYEWRELPEEFTATVPGHVQLNVPNGQVHSYVAPIIRACNRIQKEFLNCVDPVLYSHMQAVGIEPQIYGM